MRRLGTHAESRVTLALAHAPFRENTLCSLDQSERATAPLNPIFLYKIKKTIESFVLGYAN